MQKSQKTSWIRKSQKKLHLQSNFRFFWLKKEELTALGYLITVIHSVNYGNIDKAIKYSERTINQVSLHKR